MSATDTDDLDYAEGVAQTLAAAVRKLEQAIGSGVVPDVSMATSAADDYCRPTCDADGSDDPDDCNSGGDPECGCPCHNGGV